MVFDWTINLGHVLTISSLLVGVVAIIWGLKADMKLLSFRIGLVENGLDKLASVVVDLARQNERMNAIDRRLDEIALYTEPKVVR